MDTTIAESKQRLIDFLNAETDRLEEQAADSELDKYNAFLISLLGIVRNS
jgi:hypothetical protein